MTAPPPSRWLLLLRAALVALVLAVFAPHLGGDFISDDREYLRDDPRLTAPDGARHLLTEAFARGTVYRPISTLTFWAQARTQGMAVAPLRAGNVAVHLLAVQMLLTLLLRLGLAMEAAGLATALFAVHPGVTEPVMFIAARHDALGAFFIALAAWVALAPARTLRARALRAAGASLASALAMACKEPFAVTPFLLALTPWLAGDDDTLRGRLRRGAELCVGASALVLASIAWRRHLAIATDNALSDVSMRERFVDVVGTVAHYVNLAFTGRQSAMSLSWQAPSLAVALAMVAVAVGIAGGLRALRARAPTTVDRAGFGVAWLVLLAAPAAAAIPSTGQYANRYLYAPLMGWAIVVAAGLDGWMPVSSRVRRWLLATGAAVVVAFAVVSAQQAARWEHALDLYAADVEAAPDDGRVLYNLGVAVAQARGCPAALPIFLRATTRSPDFGRPWNNVAGCMLMLRRPAEAVAPARRAVALLPGDINATLNLGAALALSGDRDGARPWLTRGCAARPQAPACGLLRAP